MSHSISYGPVKAKVDRLMCRDYWPFLVAICCWLVILLMTIAGCDDQSPVETTETEHVVESMVPRHYLGDITDSSRAAVVKVRETDWWVDKTIDSGVHFTYRNGREGEQFTILETVGGGVGMFDFDQDGDVDLLFPGGGEISASVPISVTGRPCALYRNNGSGHFEDVSELLTCPAQPIYSHGVTVTDFDRDGFPDVLVTGFSGCMLLHNENGERLVDVTSKSGLPATGWSTAATSADINKDGWPDLLLIGYVEWTPERDTSCGDARKHVRDVCPPQKYPDAAQLVFLNNRDGTFALAENTLEGSGRGKGLGCVALDLNDDGWIDFYVANDQVENQLYMGGPELPMRQVAVLSATSGNEIGVPEGSMGIAAGDYDGDGLADLWVTNFELEDNSLYHNEGAGMFRHATVRAGLAGTCRPQVGFGTGFGDFDLDGWLDLVVINGHVLYETGRSPYRQAPFLLHNTAVGSERRFQDISVDRGGPWFQGRYAGRGAAIGDLDNDGDLDLVVVQQNESASVLLNQMGPHDWICLKIRGTTSEPDAVGAVVTYNFRGRDIVRHVCSGSGYLSQFDQRILLPLDKSETPHVTVRWLTGKSERFVNIVANSTNLISEGDGEPL